MLVIIFDALFVFTQFEINNPRKTRGKIAKLSEVRITLIHNHFACMDEKWFDNVFVAAFD